MITITWRSMVLATVLVLLMLLALAAVDWKRLFIRRALQQQAAYANTPSTTGAKLVQLTPRVFTFHYGFDRTLVVNTEEGLVVVDPFNRQLTESLRKSLTNAGIDKPIHTLIYTHYHLDHVRGGAVLKPRNVVAHRKCPEYWADHPRDEIAEIVQPTRLIDDDTELDIGGVTIQLLYLGLSHTDTNFAVFLPGESVLYAADTVAPRTFLPAGGISLYRPGYLRALARLEKLPFTIFVPSHFGVGSKNDFVEAAQLQRDLQNLVRETMARHPDLMPLHMHADGMQTLVDEVQPKLKQRYGNWHGFDSQGLASIFSVYTAQFIGD